MVLLISITAEYLSLESIVHLVLTKVVKLSSRGGRKEAESHTTHSENIKGLYEGVATVFVPGQQNDLS